MLIPATLLVDVIANVVIESRLQLYSALKGRAKGVLAGNDWLNGLEYSRLAVGRQVLVSDILKVGEDAILLRRPNVIYNVYKRTKRPLFTPCL